MEWRIALFSVTFSFSHIIEMERNLIEDDENKMKEELVEEEIIWNRFFVMAGSSSTSDIQFQLSKI